MRKTTFWLILLALILAACANEIETPAEEDSPEQLIARLALAYDARDWPVYDTVYTGDVQTFLRVSCGGYEECFREHRESVQSPIGYEILQIAEVEEALLIDVRYTHPGGEWCQTYEVIDTDVGYRVEFSTTPADCAP